MLVNVGDEKGELLDAAVRRADPALALELGTYCGYSALRIAGGGAERQGVTRSSSPRPTPKWPGGSGRTPGVDDRITCVVGTIGDGGQTLDALADEHGFAPGSVDLLFIDHDKSAYLTDLQSILDRGWLHTGSDRRRRQRARFPAPPSTAHTCASSRASCGTPSSTRPTCEYQIADRPTWCWSRSTSAAA